MDIACLPTEAGSRLQRPRARTAEFTRPDPPVDPKPRHLSAQEPVFCKPEDVKVRNVLCCNVIGVENVF